MRSGWLLVVALSVAGGGGVGVASGQEPSDADGPASPSPSTGLEGLSLTFWTALQEAPGVTNLVAGFERATGVEVEIVNLPPAYEANALSRWQEGERPDLMSVHPGRTWFGWLDPTRTLVDLSEEGFSARTLFGIGDVAGHIEGGHYAAVIGYPEVFGMFYNKAVVAEAGLGIPTGLDALYDACQAFFSSARGVDFVRVGGADIRTLPHFPMILWADAVMAGIGDELNAGATTLTDPRIEEAINALNSSLYRGCVNGDLLSVTYADQLASLMEGRAAMIPQGSSILAELVETYGLDAVNETVGYFPLSFRSPLATWELDGDAAFAVPVNTDPGRQAAALAFLRYATGEGYPGYLADSGQPPVLEGHAVPAGLPEALVEAHEALQAGAAPALPFVLRAPYGDLAQWLYEMADGYKTPNGVAIAMDEVFARMAGF